MILTPGNVAELLICVNEAIRLGNPTKQRFAMDTFRMVVQREYGLKDLAPLRACHRILGKLDCLDEIAQGVWEYREAEPKPVAVPPKFRSSWIPKLRGER